ncbi:MAG: thioredoxin-dependent thiol peroxidase [Phycisphaerales bacterium]|nr:MAG: thioredoxin-dependent thiol peroxidase [Phycisphaerales bacterium]
MPKKAASKKTSKKSVTKKTPSAKTLAKKTSGDATSNATLIGEGKKAPAFTLQDQDGKTHKLSDYAGRAVVLFFYPKDMTSGCTVEACDFRDLLPKFDTSKAAVLGISIMNTKSKAKFAAKEGLNYPLLADDATDEDGKPDPVVAKKFGVWVEKSMYGNTYMGIERTTYLIGPDGKIAKRWDKVKVPGHAEEVLEAARRLAQ